MIVFNEQRLATSEKRLAELEVAKAQAEADLSVRSSELESLRVQAQGFLSEADLRARALMEVEKARQLIKTGYVCAVLGIYPRQRRQKLIRRRRRTYYVYRMYLMYPFLSPL